MTTSTSPSLSNEKLEETVVKPSSVSLMTIFLAYLQVGLTAFNMAILQKLKMLVITINITFDHHYLGLRRGHRIKKDIQ